MERAARCLRRGQGGNAAQGPDRALDAPIVTALGTRADLRALMGVYLMGVPLLAECSDHWAGCGVLGHEGGLLDGRKEELELAVGPRHQAARSREGMV